MLLFSGLSNQLLTAAQAIPGLGWMVIPAWKTPRSDLTACRTWDSLRPASRFMSDMGIVILTASRTGSTTAKRRCP